MARFEPPEEDRCGIVSTLRYVTNDGREWIGPPMYALAEAELRGESLLAFAINEDGRWVKRHTPRGGWAGWYGVATERAAAAGMHSIWLLEQRITWRWSQARLARFIARLERARAAAHGVFDPKHIKTRQICARYICIARAQHRTKPNASPVGTSRREGETGRGWKEGRTDD